ncbi:MAG: alpha/beta hydrolase family protein [Pirellulaceae bacterium]
MELLRRSERVRFSGSEGRRLAGILDSPQTQPKGYCLFSHCFTCSKDLKAIVRISRNLAEHGWGVLRYDFAGLGESDGDFATTNFSTNLIDLQAAHQFLAAHHQAPVLLMGHSFGGAATLAMAPKLSGVRGIVSIAAPSDTGHLADLMLRKNPRIASEGRGEVNIGGRDWMVTREMIEDFRSHDLPARVAEIPMPVLVVHSPKDETLGFYHALRLYGLLTQRDAAGVPPAAVSLLTLLESDHLFLNSPADLTWLVRSIDAFGDRLLVP